MRSMRISDLSNLNQTRTVTRTAPPTRSSRAPSSSPTRPAPRAATQGTPSADYILITSTVTWPSIGSRAAGARAEHRRAAERLGLGQQRRPGHRGRGRPERRASRVGLSGSGAGLVQRHHRQQRLRHLRQPAGGQLHADRLGLLAGRPRRQPAAATSDQRGRREHQHGGAPVRPPGDDPGRTSRPGSGGNLVPSSADSIVAFNTGMSTAKAFGTPGTPAAHGHRHPAVPVRLPLLRLRRHLRGRQPQPQRRQRTPRAPPRSPNVARARRAAAQTATIELPALHLTVWSGSSGRPRARRSPTPRAVADKNCPDGRRRRSSAPSPPTRRASSTTRACPTASTTSARTTARKHVSATGVSVEDLERRHRRSTSTSAAAASTSGACP